MLQEAVCMVKEEFYFDSEDGKNKLYGVRYIPDEGRKVCCVLQIVHGMAEYVERYEEFAAFLTEKGFVVTGEDHLGHGKSVGKKGKQGYFCKQDPAAALVENVHQLRELTQKLYKGVPYVLMGHSMGSFIARNYMFRHGKGLAGVVIMGTGMEPLMTVKAAQAVTAVQKLFFGDRHTSRLVDRLAFGAYNKKIEHPRTDFDWLSRDRSRVDQYIADPQCGFVFTVNGFEALFELISRLYRRENLAYIPKELPVYMVSGTADPVGGYGIGVVKAYRSLKEAGLESVELKLYRGGRHELLNETNRDEVMRGICKWIEAAVLEK